MNTGGSMTPPRSIGTRHTRTFVTAMTNGGAGAHLDAMVSFLKANRLDGALRRRDWAAFARGYSGPGYATE
jgi:hypothetical protein